MSSADTQFTQDCPHLDSDMLMCIIVYYLSRARHMVAQGEPSPPSVHCQECLAPPSDGHGTIARDSGSTFANMDPRVYLPFVISTTQSQRFSSLPCSPWSEEYSPAPISEPQARRGTDSGSLSEETYLSAKLLMNP